jgi:hypothetical protein
MAFDDEDFINEQLRDKDQFKSEKDIGNQSTILLLLSKRQIAPEERSVVVQQRSISGDSLIWGSVNFGIWGDQNWGSTTEASFILGHPSAGLLGISTLGSQASDWETIRVVNNDRTFVEVF